MTYMRSLLVLSSAIVLCACGSGPRLGGGKEGAASALFAATSPAKSSGALADLFGQRFNQSVEVTVDCELGGRARLSVSQRIDGGATGNVSQQIGITLEGCANSRTDTGEKVVLDGKLQITQSIAWSSGAGSVSQKIVGSVRFSGGIDDQLDADITQSVEWAKLGASSGEVAVTLNGTLKTMSATYEYRQESVKIRAGVLVADAKK